MDNTSILQVILTSLGIGGGYFVGRKKNRAEVKKIEATTRVNEMEATEKAVAIWRGLAEELRSEVEHLRDLVNELREEIDELKAQNESLRKEMLLYKSNNNA